MKLKRMGEIFLIAYRNWRLMQRLQSDCSALELREMHDGELRDLGIGRGQIPHYFSVGGNVSKVENTLAPEIQTPVEGKSGAIELPQVRNQAVCEPIRTERIAMNTMRSGAST